MKNNTVFKKIIRAVRSAAYTVKNMRKFELEAATQQAIFDSIPDFIFCKDLNLKYTRCNKHMENYFGVSEADLIGKDDADGLGAPPEMVRLCNESDMKILKEGKPTVSEEVVPGAGGAMILCETIKVPIIQNGEIVGLVGVARDITKRKEHEEAIISANRAKTAFLSNMSHEMRTPMNAIIGMSTIGKASSDIEKISYCFAQIEDASKHLLGVINSVLDMSKIEAENFSLSPVDFDFKKMIERVINLISIRIEEKKLILNVNIDEQIPAGLFGDEQRFSQVIINLLGNAVKFTPQGGTVSLDVDLLDASQDECLIQTSVTDTGIGISPDEQHELFKPFRQVENDYTRRFGGTGLGLSISKSIVEMMGGKIGVESEPGKGSKFAFTVRLKKMVDDRGFEPLTSALRTQRSPS